MFFNEKTVKNKNLNNAWRAGWNQNVLEPIEPINNVCTELKKLIDTDHQNPLKRLSLRTSAVLIDGTVKLYKRQMDQLRDDVFKLNYDIIKRKRRKLNEEEEEESEESDSLPEEMMSQALGRFSNVSNTIERERTERRQTISPLNVNLSAIENTNTTDTNIRSTTNDSIHDSKSINNSNNRLAIDTSDGTNNSDITNSNIEDDETDEIEINKGDNESNRSIQNTGSKEQNKENNYQPVRESDRDEEVSTPRSPILESICRRKSKKVSMQDQSCQTSISHSPTVSERDIESRRIPYGQLFVYDSPNSRIPSKIIISSLNPNIRNLI